MKKRFIALGVILSLICIFLIACESKKDNPADDPYKDFEQTESSYGIKYKIPKSWIAVDSNSDDTSLYYKNELGDNDGLLSVVYHKFNGNVLDSKNVEKVKDSIKKSQDYKDDLKGEYAQVNSIDVEKLYYNKSIDGKTYKNEMLVFPVKNGYFVVCAMSLPENDYSSEFDKIFESIEITSAYDTTEATTEEPTTTEVTTEATTEKTTEVYEPTTGEENALNKAFDYLDYNAFSKSGLIKQLKYEGFTTKEAKYAANNCNANWKDQAYKKATSYLESQSFSKSGLIKQLEYEGFTNSQAKYGANKAYK